MPHTDLDVRRIAEAASVIDPVFLNTPQFFDEQLGAALGRRVLTKVETLNPLRSFKGRGAEFFAESVPAGSTLVCASSGNFGQGVAYAARRRGLGAEVFVPEGVNPVKLARMRALGARVHEAPVDKMAALAQQYAEERDGHVYIKDGLATAIAEGAGTIGRELLAAGPIDTLLLQVGDGALITGVATWVKEHSPVTRIVGVCAEGAPSMALSWRAGKPVPTDGTDTFAGGITTANPVPESVARMRELVDDMVLVSDQAMLTAMRTAARTLGLLLEPAGAAGLAAIAEHDLPGDVLAVVLTGANADTALLPDITS